MGWGAVLGSVSYFVWNGLGWEMGIVDGWNGVNAQYRIIDCASERRGEREDKVGRAWMAPHKARNSPPKLTHPLS